MKQTLIRAVMRLFQNRNINVVPCGPSAFLSGMSPVSDAILTLTRSISSSRSVMRPAFLLVLIPLLGLPVAENDRLVFGSFRNGDFSSTIMSVNTHNDVEERLSLHASGRPASLDPWISPDGSELLFTRGGGDHRSAVWQLDLSTGKETALTREIMVRFGNGRAWPSRRPVTGELTYVAERNGTRNIMLDDGSGENALTQGEFPEWSPDGTMLAFVRRVGGSGQLVIREMSTGAETVHSGGFDDIWFASWSPDGMQLAIVGDGDIHLITREGVVLKQVTCTATRREASIAWSPDGTKLAFAAGSDDAAQGWEHSVFVLDLVEGGIDQVTSGRYHDTRPNWVPRNR